MPRIQGLTEVYLTGDTLLKPEGAVEIFSIVLAFHGAAAGQQIVFRNGLLSTSDALLVVTLNGANGTINMDFANGKRFNSGCYVDFQGAQGGLDLSLTYK